LAFRRFYHKKQSKFRDKSSNYQSIIGTLFTKNILQIIHYFTRLNPRDIHIFSNLLIHLNCENQYNEWKKILEDIFIELMHKINSTFSEKNQAKELDVASWEETVKSVF